MRWRKSTSSTPEATADSRAPASRAPPPAKLVTPRRGRSEREPRVSVRTDGHSCSGDSNASLGSTTWPSSSAVTSVLCTLGLVAAPVVTSAPVSGNATARRTRVRRDVTTAFRRLQLSQCRLHAPRFSVTVLKLRRGSSFLHPRQYTSWGSPRSTDASDAGTTG